jgi:hypothetical protein
MECRCTNVTELYGTEAADYITGHLQPDGDSIADRYVCPDTGSAWQLDDTDPEQTRLVQL